jgi:hypothetical protein
MAKKIYIVKTPVSYGEKDAKGEVQVEATSSRATRSSWPTSTRNRCSTWARSRIRRRRRRPRSRRAPKKVERAAAAAEEVTRPRA